MGILALAALSGCQESLSDEFQEDQVIAEAKEMVERINAGELEDALITSESIRELERKSCFLRDKVLSIMGALRAACDDMESVTADDAWPIPTYGELLYGVK